MRLTLNGYVVSDDDQWLYDWFGFGAFSPGMIRHALESMPPDDDTLTLEINSGGGSVFAGFEAYAVLRGARCKTRAEVQSIAASAASTVASACNEVMMSPVGQMMIHMPTTVTCGDQSDHAQSIHTLDSITESILNGYELRCKSKTTRDHLRNLMAAETWLPAQDAIQLGLADGILYQDGESGIVPSNIVNAVGGGIRALAAGGAMPSIDTLRAEYNRLVAQGAAPAPGQSTLGTDPNNDPGSDPAGNAPPAPEADAWRDSARLNIEKNRYF